MSEIPVSTWPIVAPNDDGIRPAGGSGMCMYCRQAIGLPHDQSCVIVTKRVRLRYLIEVDVDLPHAWDEAQILFNRNDGTWCANNVVKELKNTSDESGCLCDRVTAEFVRVVDDTPRRKLKASS